MTNRPSMAAVFLLSSTLALAEASAASPRHILPPIQELGNTPYAPVTVEQTVVVEAFHLVGNTVLKLTDINPILEDYAGRGLRFADLQELCDQLTALYAAQGYINSGVILPVQTVTNRVIELQAIEGRLAQSTVNTDGRFSPPYIQQRLGLDKRSTVNVYRIEEQLRLLQQDPRIATVSATLLPGPQPHEALLDVTLQEHPAITMTAGVNNHSSPSVDEKTVVVGLSHNNLSGIGNQLSASFSHSEGASQGSASYSHPLSPDGAQLSIKYDYSRNRVVDEVFADLDIEGELSTASLLYSAPLLQTVHNRLNWSATLDIRHSESYLLGEPFSFSAGSENGVIDLNVLRLGASWRQQSNQQVFASNLSLNTGLRASNTTVHTGDDVVPDSDFLSLLVQTHLVRKLGFLHSNIQARLDLQAASDALYSMEQFSIGGHSTVRGYRENLYLGDHGGVASLEYRIPLLRQTTESLGLALFSDHGRSWRVNGDASSSHTLSSAGLGLVGKLGDHLLLNLYWAQALTAVEIQGEEQLQDDGLHLSLVSSWPLGD